MSETGACRDRLLPFCEGNGVDLGCGGDKIKGEAIGIDMVMPYTEIPPGTVQLRGDAMALYWFNDGVLDYVYSSHLLEDFPSKDTIKVMTEWLRVLKVGGNLVLNLPDEPKFKTHCEESGQGYNLAHQNHELTLEWFKQNVVKQFPNAEIIYENPNGGVYSFEIVLKKKEQ